MAGINSLRIGYVDGGNYANRLSELIKKFNAGTITPEEEHEMEQLEIMLDYGRPGEAQGGRIGYNDGGLSEYEIFKLKELKYDVKKHGVKPFGGVKVLREILKLHNYNKGGRVGFQTGGITQDQRFQPEYIEALGKTYAADLTRQAGIPAITQATQQMPGETASQFAQRQAQAQQFDITQQSMGLLAPQVAAQDPMQAAAYTQATDPTYGLGAYQPYTADARAAAQAATGLTGPMTGAQLATIDPTTGQTVTPTLAPGSYMSPYQQQVIDATMADYDAQAAKSRLALGAPSVAGVFGGGRHGIAEAEFDALSGRGRGTLLADLRQRGFQQAQAGRQQDFANQQALATQQAGLGTQAMGNVQRQIAGLGTLGATQQVQNQAVLDAQRQFAGMAVNEPQQRLGMLGQGVTGLMGGMQGYGTTIGQAPPQTSPLGTALGIGSTLAGIYGMGFLK